MARSVLDGLTGTAADLVQLGWGKAFLLDFDGGKGGQRGAERLSGVVGRRKTVGHGMVLRIGGKTRVTGLSRADELSPRPQFILRVWPSTMQIAVAMPRTRRARQ